MGKTGKAKGRGKKAELTMNLDVPSGSDDDFAPGSESEGGDLMNEGEKKHMAALQTILKKCQRCGPDIMCKIDLNGNHTKITFSMVHSWTLALVCIKCSSDCYV